MHAQGVRGFSQIAASRKSLAPLQPIQQNCRKSVDPELVQTVPHSENTGQASDQPLLLQQYLQTDLHSEGYPQQHGAAALAQPETAKAMVRLSETAVGHAASGGAALNSYRKTSPAVVQDGVTRTHADQQQPTACTSPLAHLDQAWTIEAQQGRSQGMLAKPAELPQHAPLSAVRPLLNAVPQRSHTAAVAHILPGQAAQLQTNAADAQPRSNCQQTLGALVADNKVLEVPQHVEDGHSGSLSGPAASAHVLKCSPSAASPHASPEVGPCSLQQTAPQQPSPQVASQDIGRKRKPRSTTRANSAHAKAGTRPRANKSDRTSRGTAKPRKAPASASANPGEDDNPAAGLQASGNVHRAKRQCRQRTAAVVESSSADEASADGSRPNNDRPVSAVPTADATEQAQAHRGRNGSSRLDGGHGVSPAAEPVVQIGSGSSDDCAWSDAASSSEGEEEEDQAVPDSPEVAERAAGKRNRSAVASKAKAAAAKSADRGRSKLGTNGGRGGSSGGRRGAGSIKGPARGGRGGVAKPAARRQNFVRNNLKVTPVQWQHRSDRAANCGCSTAAATSVVVRASSCPLCISSGLQGDVCLQRSCVLLFSSPLCAQGGKQKKFLSKSGSRGGAKRFGRGRFKTRSVIHAAKMSTWQAITAKVWVTTAEQAEYT